MKFPEKVLTKTKKGKILVRNLVKRGKFVEYDYRNPDNFKQEENGKIRIFLKDVKGNVESYFIIPLKNDGRFLMIKADKDEKKILWNNSKKKAEKLW